MHGWVSYTDGIMKTDDGGVSWYAAATSAVQMDQSSQTSKAIVENEDLKWIKGSLPSIQRIAAGAKELEVKKSQFLTENVGWALIAKEGQDSAPLWTTTDGGRSWKQQVTPELVKQMEMESLRLQSIAKEAEYYADSETARKAIQSEWTLMPETAARGDIVLVRHRSPGNVEWQGKTYELQPFASGYFTYLPIPMNTKAGSYPIGDKTLTIKEKKFETQYLQVTKQMESMKQDTKTIQADQKKIDLARSKSEPEFLFSSPFIQPIEGILTTPYGYTRYVNGKLDSSHMAIDLAAKTGTPIKATNDGIVALAESLYLTGNSIYIDHGMNLFSQYAHLSELKVKTGDHVKQGDIIGLVGTTGFSTGPHLHFTFWAHNMQANPNLFFNTKPFNWFQPAP
ncbi:peptidoglycan DD-metalloendopeptidase family protein [Paenibacillus sp. LMG 31456]|uniref:Peptidoglycan DD-metalloendopeptidase family protein n=2 Tax=Paenibacillus foliorum TaxID=2654974 RepID=A0A972K5J4_9BACL|nr:peptidoglycan DD-metalloendopeptidase family protein [Paenibacillus foliorum]